MLFLLNVYDSVKYDAEKIDITFDMKVAFIYVALPRIIIIPFLLPTTVSGVGCGRQILPVPRLPILANSSCWNGETNFKKSTSVKIQEVSNILDWLDVQHPGDVH